MKELRSIQTEFKYSNGNTCEGYGLIFNTLSNKLFDKDKRIFFRERIEPIAINGIIEKCDIVALFNHEDNLLLARHTPNNVNNTLTLKVDNKGLYYSFQIPDTTIGNDLKFHLSKNNIRNSSFAFTVANGGETWKIMNGENIRTITKFERIYDVSPVIFSAYDTEVAIRKLQENVERMEKELNEYFEELQSQIDRLKK